MTPVSKTKLFASLFGILVVLQSTGVIHLSPETLQAIQTLLGVGVTFGLRDAIAKSGEGK